MALQPPPIPPVLGNTVKFSLNRWDIFRCRLWVVAHSKFLIAMHITLCSLIAALYGIPSSKDGQSSFAFATFSFIFFFVLMSIVMAVFQIAVHGLMIIVTKRPGMMGKHELEIRDDGLLERTPTTESLHRWQGIRKVGRSRHFLFVFVTEVNVEYVPLSAFPTQETAMTFKGAIEKRIGTNN